MSYETIEYELTDAVAVIRLNDPTTLNAMSQKMGTELLDALKRGEREARAVLLCGAGRGFCSGANLADNNMDPTDPQRDLGMALDALFNPIVYQFARWKSPW